MGLSKYFDYKCDYKESGGCRVCSRYWLCICFLFLSTLGHDNTGD